MADRPQPRVIKSQSPIQASVIISLAELRAAVRAIGVDIPESANVRFGGYSVDNKSTGLSFPITEDMALTLTWAEQPSDDAG